MDRVRDFLLFVCACVAVFSLLLAAYQAFNEKLGSATVLGAIFLVSVLVVFLPKLELLKAFGVEARLTKTLDRAEEIIGKMKELSENSARATYMLMAWGNRMGTPPAVERQAVMDQIGKQLTDLGVPPDQRAEIARPYVRMIGFDWHYWFTRMLEKYVDWKNHSLRQAMNANHTEENQKSLRRILWKL